MSRTIFSLSLLISGFYTTLIHADSLLTGNERLACEATLCLASSVRPGECSPSLNKYFSIKKKKIKRTLRARLNFLKLCPVGDGGKTVKRVQNTYALCDYGKISANCAQLDNYTGEALGGFCTSHNGITCDNFVESKYLDQNGNIALSGTYGLCIQENNPLQDIYTNQPNKSTCATFNAETPDDFGASAAARALAATN